MLDQLLAWDKETLLYINNLGSPVYDTFWLVITKTTHWIPLFLLFILLFFLKFPWQKALARILWIVLLTLAITGLSNLVKDAVARIRPCNDIALNHMMRIIHTPSDFSFFSGHASSSFAVTVLVFLLLRAKVKWAGLFFIWPILFSYSRLYLGVHYPLDVISGALAGTLMAWLFYLIYHRLPNPAQSKSVPNGQ